MKNMIAAFAAFAAVFAASAIDSKDFTHYFEARNIAANKMIAPAGLADDEAPDLSHPVGMVTMKCPACEGKGEIVLDEPDYGQWEGMLKKNRIERKRCPVCKGQRSWKAYPQPGDLAQLAAKGRMDYISAHQAKGEVAVGQAFVPRESHDAVPRKQLKLVEEAYGKPCPRCEWTGFEPCKTCKGNGVVKCTAKDCKNGWVITQITVSLPQTQEEALLAMDDGEGGESGLFASPDMNVFDCPMSAIRSNSSTIHNNSRHRYHSDRNRARRQKTTVTECPVCGGCAMLLCPDCSGRRANTCQKCHGSGIKLKR